MKVDINNCSLRDCFDFSSQEWKDTTLDEKIDKLKLISEKNNINIVELALGMQDYCNNAANKSIKDKEVMISLAYLLDHLIKRDLNEKL